MRKHPPRKDGVPKPIISHERPDKKLQWYLQEQLVISNTKPQHRTAAQALWLANAPKRIMELKLEVKMSQ